MKIKRGRGKRKRIKENKGFMLPNIDTNSHFADQSGRHFSSGKKPNVRNLSESVLKKNSKLRHFNSARKTNKSSRMKRGKNTLSLPKLGANIGESAISSRLQGFTSVAKNQATERKKLETYFKSLDRAVQILRQKKQSELSNRHWIPAGPVRSFHHRPSSKYG